MDNRNLCVFDFETSSADKETCQILQIGACIIDGKKLKIVDSFSSLVMPENFDTVEDGALAVNGLTIEVLKEAPTIDVVWPLFTGWIKKYYVGNSSGTWGAPIPCGYNIVGFDMPILSRYCKKFKQWDNKFNNQSLLNPIHSFDVMQQMWFLTRCNQDLTKLKLSESVLPYMGVSQAKIDEGGHDALFDATMTAEIAIKLLKFGRYITEERNGKTMLKMRDCMKE